MFMSVDSSKRSDFAAKGFRKDIETAITYRFGLLDGVAREWFGDRVEARERRKSAEPPNVASQLACALVGFQMSISPH